MFLSFISSPLLTLFLCCITSSLAFIGVNYINFTRKQAVNSVCICFVCALALCPLFLFLPPAFRVILICGIFFVFNEKFISSFFKNKKSLLIFLVIFNVIISLIIWQFGYTFINALFILYGIFSCVDIYKNSKLPKENLFCMPNNADDTKSVDQENEYNIELKKKNDIVILFLESIHSRSALNTLYGIDDASLYDYLEEKDFNVYPNAYSNGCDTVRSFATLVNMTAYDSVPDHKPNALQILHANGYDIQLFDSIIYPFQSILKFASYFNLIIPPYVIKLFHFAIPFFLQSSFFMKFVENIDPFDDSISNEKVKNDFARRFSKDYKNPQCYIVRMGAIHTPVTGYVYGEKTEAWKKRYRSRYLEASGKVQEAIEIILKHNPDTIIGIMGDHGALSFRGADLGKPFCAGENLLEKGISTLLACSDRASIIFALRFPMSDHGHKDFGISLHYKEELRSPCNLFRHIFKWLGGEGSFLENARDDTIFYSHNGWYLMVKDGVPLESWEELLTTNLHIEYKLLYLSHGQVSSPIYKEMVQLLESKDIVRAIETSSEALAAFPNDFELRSQLIMLLVRVGKLELAASFSLPMDNHYNDYIYVKALQGKYAVALRLLDDKYEYVKYPEKLRAEILSFAGEKEQAAVAAEKHFEYVLSKNGMSLKDSSEALVVYLEHLEESGQAAKALQVCENINVVQFPFIRSMLSRNSLLTLLAFRAFSNTGHINLSILPPTPIAKFFCLGYFEQQGKMPELIKTVEENYDNIMRLGMGKSQLGLLAIRKKIKHPLFTVHKKAAYDYLRYCKSFFQRTNTFDEEWYKGKYGHLIGDENPFTHFLHHRILLVLDPNPFFNSMYVYMTNTDVLDGGYDPFFAFLGKNALSDESPSLYFNSRHYIANNPDIVNVNTNILLDYYAKQYTQKIETFSE